MFFVEGSNQIEQQLLKNYHKYLVTTTKYTTSTEISMKEKSNVKFSKALESMGIFTIQMRLHIL